MYFEAIVGKGVDSHIPYTLYYRVYDTRSQT